MKFIQKLKCDPEWTEMIFGGTVIFFLSSEIGQLCPKSPHKGLNQSARQN